MEKHEVDPTTQESLPPPTPQQVADGAAIEGSYTTAEPAPIHEQIVQPETLSPEQERIAQLEAKDIALDFLGRAAETGKKITNMGKRQTRLRLAGTDEAEQTRLGTRIARSEATQSRFRRVAKKHFALSRGIETIEITVPKFIQAKGVTKNVKEVVATEPECQAELEAGYGPFLGKYKDKKKLRENRRAEITQEIAGIRAGSVSVNRTAQDHADGPKARSVTVHEEDATEETPRSLADVIYIAGNAMVLEDLVQPEFDPEQVLTMAEYIGQIGTRMTIAPREDSTEDSALGVHRRDFSRAALPHVANGLFWTGNRARPEKLVVKVVTWYCDLDRTIYKGVVPFSTDVTVSEELYEAIVGNPAWFSNKIANRTEKANQGPVVEKDEDLGGESALYGLAAKHILLEAYDEGLLEERRQLVAVKNNLDPNLPISPKRVRNLEPYRFAAVTAVRTMVRLAGKVRNYGTNETQDTWNAVFSEMHRSHAAARNFLAYTAMAINYNDAVRGKINQSIHGIGQEISIQAEHAISNIDRVYKAKDKD